MTAEAAKRATKRKGTESARKPSQVLDDYWLYAHRKKGRYPEPTKNNGKWMIFVNVEDVDQVWSEIRQATEEGRLGSSSKVATMRPNPNAKDPRVKVICIYTYDWGDVTDVRRVRQVLRDIGHTHKIPYKPDAQTLAGKYSHNGDRVSTYYE